MAETRFTKLSEEIKNVNDRLDKLMPYVDRRFDQMAVLLAEKIAESQRVLLDRLDTRFATLKLHLTNTPNQSAPIIHTQPDLGDSSTQPRVQAEPSLLGSPPAVVVPHGGPQMPAHQHSVQPVRIDVPLFDGSDLENWLFLLSVHFDCYSVPYDQRLVTACLHLTGAAMTWYRGLCRLGKITDWPSFVSAVRQRFGPSAFVDYYGRISRMTQTGSVPEFISQFESLVVQVPDIPEHMLVSIFISGLRPKIRRELQLLKPLDLFVAFKLARAQETRIDELKVALTSSGFSRNSFSPTGGTSQCSMGSAGKSDFRAGVMPKDSGGLPFRNMSHSEILKRQEQGKCFHCEGEWTKGHLCKQEFHVLLLPEDPTEEVIAEVEEHPACLHTLVNQPEGHSIRFDGYCNGVWVDVLWDSGSSTNFVQSTVAKKLRLEQIPCGNFLVQTGGGALLKCVSICKQVLVCIQGFQFTIDFFVVELQGAEMILGMQWFEQLGEVVTNFGLMTVSFQLQGQQVLLTGRKCRKTAPISVNQLQKSCAQVAIESTFQLRIVQNYQDMVSLGQENKQPFVLPAIQGLLDKFNDVFGPPQGLSPTRSWGHLIHLQQRAERLESGAALLQGGHPISHFRKELGPWRKEAPTYVRELYALTQAVQKFRHSLLGKHFVLRTDHCSLKILMNQVIRTPGLHHSLPKLPGFVYEILHKPGRDNKAADAFSRLHKFNAQGALETAMVFSVLHCPVIVALLKKDVREGKHILELTKSLCVDESDTSICKCQNDVFYYKNRVVVGITAGVRDWLFKEVHESNIGGHSGTLKAYMTLAANFLWTGMEKGVQYRVEESATYQLIVALDFVPGLPLSHGFKAIMVVVDRPPPALPCFADLNSAILVPEAILDCRTVIRKSNPFRQVLIKWKTLPANESSWDPYEDSKTCPSLHLEDKVFFNGGGSVRATNNLPVSLVIEEDKAMGDEELEADDLEQAEKERTSSKMKELIRQGRARRGNV